jgi:hypothetical protein
VKVKKQNFAEISNIAVATIYNSSVQAHRLSAQAGSEKKL